jgi:hypothetical protein
MACGFDYYGHRPVLCCSLALALLTKSGSGRLGQCGIVPIVIKHSSDCATIGYEILSPGFVFTVDEV